MMKLKKQFEKLVHLLGCPYAQKLYFLTAILLISGGASHLYAVPIPNQFYINTESFLKPVNFSSSVNLLLSLSTISLIPFFLISTTSFLRIVIVLGMVRNAIGTQQSPPNSIIIALSLFMTIFIMSPVWQEVYRISIQPYQEKKITQGVAFERAIQPFRTFMLKNVKEKDLALFIEFSRIKKVTDVSEIPIFVIIPAFIISEINTAFQIGFLIFIPFVVVDLIVSNILLSLGMFMLSPVMISLPFKILLFVLTDGWNLIIRGLILSYQ